MCTQQREWGAILSWDTNVEKNRKQDASESRLAAPGYGQEASSHRETPDSCWCSSDLPLSVENFTFCVSRTE